MKTLKNSFVLTAIAVLGIVSCNEASLTPDLVPEEGKLVTVYFGTENTDPSTKATLTPNAGETAFAADWVNGDMISVYYLNDNTDGTVPATWKGSSFSADLPEYTGNWEYAAAYPIPDANDNVDFGASRTQKGNAYNSKYDIMIGEASATDAEAGKDKSGKDIIFKMTRQTAIAYFHFTSNNNEAITKATLKVEGEGAAIASTSASVSNFAWNPVEDCQSITITFPEEAPNAQDFKLWFNVLPTIYKSITLTVETATKTFTISKDATENLAMYEAGKLYKVKKENIAWTDKPVTPSVSVVNVNNVNAVKVMGNGSYGNYNTVQTITVDGLEYSMINICANTKNGSTGYMMDAKQFIQMKSESSYIFNTKNGVTNIKAWVLPTTTDAISVYQGSTSDNISSLINKPDKTTETVKLISYSGSEVDTQLDIYEYTITDGFFKLAPSATLWLYKLEVTYSIEPTYSISLADLTGGTLSATPSEAEAGAEVSLTATPDEGYKFNNDWTATNAETLETITVKDSKFTMPAANVTVSASFSKVDYSITKTESDRGSIVAKKGETVVETAQIGDEITLTATPNVGFELTSWEVVDSKGTDIKVVDNKFTMPASNVTITATFRSTTDYTVSFSVNGNVTNRSYKESEKIVFPDDPEISGVTFMGWTTNAIVGTQAEAPDFVETSSAVMGTENLSYYAVFATQGTEKVSETIGQTLAYDTWTYAGSTTNMSSYRLFHSGSYIESAEFDLSTLTKVVVYGGTYGGNYNKLTIGDGTKTWKSVTVSGNSQTGTNTYTDGTPLTGTGKLRITSNSGTASSTGVRISKVVIYVGVYAYTDYCTNVVTLTSVAVSGDPTKMEYTVNEAFDPTGLTVTGTYSNRESAEITDGISWECSPTTFAASGNQPVSVTATVKSIKSAAYVVNVTVNTITNTLKATDKSINVNSNLDVSSLFTTNSDATIDYTLVENPSNAGTLSGSSFSATAAGTYKVKASQAATTKYSAAEATAIITVKVTTTVTLGTDWNTLFGTSYTGTFSTSANNLSLSGTNDGVTISVVNGNSKNGYVKTSDFRAYTGYTITLSVPDGKKITAISTTKGGKTFTSGISANTGNGSIKNNAYTWSGSSQTVILSISDTVSFATIVVTYE